jgi:hypothetical protein
MHPGMVVHKAQRCPRRRHVAQAEASSKPVALCTVVQSIGSTPRHVGSKMLVYPDGHFIGTVGGGNNVAPAPTSPSNANRKFSRPPKRSSPKRASISRRSMNPANELHERGSCALVCQASRASPHAPLESTANTTAPRYIDTEDSNGLLEIEYEPEAKSTSSVAHSPALSQRNVILESPVSAGILNDPLKAG